MIVTFCGHRDCNDFSDSIIRLYAKIEDLINTGYREFYLGGYGNFDLAAARALRTYKDLCPTIKRTLVLPYANKSYDRELYDNVIYPLMSDVPKKYAIIKRNEWMVENSDVLIACVERPGGAAKTLEYAEKLGKRIIRI